MNNYISRFLGLGISVNKQISSETLQWEKETLIRWAPATVFSPEVTEVKAFHQALGEAIAFAEKLSVMSNDELTKLANASPEKHHCAKIDECRNHTTNSVIKV